MAQKLDPRCYRTLATYNAINYGRGQKSSSGGLGPVSISSYANKPTGGKRPRYLAGSGGHLVVGEDTIHAEARAVEVVVDVSAARHIHCVVSGAAGGGVQGHALSHGGDGAEAGGGEGGHRLSVVCIGLGDGRRRGG